MIKGIFLGTGSIPTKERCCQGVLLEFNNNSVLVDCGEGIQYQLLKSNMDLSKINSIFITHEHMDHVYGIGGVLILLLNKYPEKLITLYAPVKVIKIVKGIIDLFTMKTHSRIEYVEISGGETIKRDSFICSTFKTYHTESSLGYSFQFENKKIALLGDVALPNIQAQEHIINSIFEANLAVIDGVHITEIDAATIAMNAKIKSLYLMPLFLNKAEDDVINEVNSIFNKVYIPKDLEEFKI